MFAVSALHSFHPSCLSSSCSLALNATGSDDRPSCESCLMTAVGMPLGLSNLAFGIGCGAVRLFIEAIVFCFAEGFPAHAIMRPAATFPDTPDRQTHSAADLTKLAF